MNKKISTAFRRLLFCAGIFAALLLTLSNCAVFLDSYAWWFISMLALIFPVLFCITAVFFFGWLFIKPRQSIAFAIPLLLSIPALLNSFALNNPPAFNYSKPAGNFRVVTWNVGLLNLMAANTSIAEANNAAIFQQLKSLKADVVCLQEFFTAVVPGNEYNFIDSITKTMGYPYYYFSKDIPYYEGQFFSGNIIFSKHKIIESSRSVYVDPHFGALLKITIESGKDTVDIFTSRLRSVNFGYNEYATIDKMKKISDFRIGATASILKKLRAGFRERSGQLEIVKSDLQESIHPFVFAGDLNDVPTGYAYAILKKNRQDVWIEKGFGIGRTFKYISHTLRIDCIFTSKHFETVQTKRVISQGSDHYGLVTDIIIKKEAE